jgi:hypothetical protein
LQVSESVKIVFFKYSIFVTFFTGWCDKLATNHEYGHSRVSAYKLPEGSINQATPERLQRGKGLFIF